MNDPALKREVSKLKKMLKLINPRLRRSNVMLNSFCSCISNTPKEFSRTPEMSFSEMVSEPGMFFKKFKGTITLKQLQSLANTDSWRDFNKQVNMVNSNIEFINLKPFSVSNLPEKEFTIHPQPVKLEGVFCIFNFPHKVEDILSKTVFSRFQIHFSSPETLIRSKVLTMLDVYFKEPSISASFTNNSKELNLMEDGDSSPNLKVWVSSP